MMQPVPASEPVLTLIVVETGGAPTGAENR